LETARSAVRPSYTYTDLGVLGTPPLHAFLWERGVMTDLGTHGGDDEATEAFAIDNRGQIVGVSPTALGERHAFL
jgi:uncharacterized membrane protein